MHNSNSLNLTRFNDERLWDEFDSKTLSPSLNDLVSLVPANIVGTKPVSGPFRPKSNRSMGILNLCLILASMIYVYPS